MSAIDEVTAAFVHELNQPLTALTLYLQMIERVYSRETAGAVLPQRTASILEKSIREAERASNILQNLRQSLDDGDGAIDVEANGVAEQGEAPNEAPEPLDDLREGGGDLAVSRAIAQDCGGDLVVDSGERERSTPRPGLPARASAPPAEEEPGPWVNV
jgi:signal transduction histidine kinase